MLFVANVAPSAAVFEVFGVTEQVTHGMLFQEKSPLAFVTLTGENVLDPDLRVLARDCKAPYIYSALRMLIFSMAAPRFLSSSDCGAGALTGLNKLRIGSQLHDVWTNLVHTTNRPQTNHHRFARTRESHSIPNPIRTPFNVS